MNPVMTVRAPEALQKALSEKAEKEGLGRNALILLILWDYLKNEEKK